MDLSEKYMLPEIPARCIKCPGLKAAIERVRSKDLHAETLKSFADMAMQGTPSVIREVLTDVTGIPDEVVQEAISGFDARLRQNIAEDMDLADESIDKERYEMAQCITNCSGILKLRVNREGLEYTVSICGSRSQISADNPIAADLHLRPLE